VRREIRQLNEAQLKEFLEGLNEMKDSGVYDEFVQLHAKYIKKYHRTHNFLLYNRAFLLKFDKELKQINPHLNTTIWDWSRDSVSPESSRILGLFGGNGRKSDQCVTEGVVKKWVAKYPTTHCIKREWDLGNKIKSFPPPEYIRAMIVRSKTCPLLNEQVDLVMRHVHQSIGGDLKNVLTAINDPLYILSAAFADRIFADWEKIH
ncbi:Di-copper centre-containing protein, partial [Basidiobolus meristosporus CBS 931.73]